MIHSHGNLLEVLDWLQVSKNFYLFYIFPTSHSFQVRNTVVTPNKGQSIFGKIGSNKEISQIPLFVFFDK